MDGRNRDTYHAYLHSNGETWILPDSPHLSASGGILAFRDRVLGPHIGEFESRPEASRACKDWLCVRETLDS